MADDQKNNNRMNSQFDKEDHDNNDALTPEALDQLREKISIFLIQEESSVASAANNFSLHFNHFSAAEQFEGVQGGKLQEFLLSWAESTEQKQQNLLCMAKVALKLIDYLAEERHHTQIANQQYERAIEQLQEENSYLASRNTNIQNDAEYFRERLVVTEGQLERVITQESEEKLGKEEQIEILEANLRQIQDELTVYKHNNLRDSEENPRYSRVKSELILAPRHDIENLESLLNDSQTRIHYLESEIARLQKKLDAHEKQECKVRSRRSSKLEMELREKVIEESASETHQNDLEDVKYMEPSPSAFFALNKVNLQADIQEIFPGGLKHICSNQSLFANLEMQDLCKADSKYFKEEPSTKCLKLELSSAIIEQTVDRAALKSHSHAAVSTEKKVTVSCSTMTQKEKIKETFLTQAIIKPVVNRLVWILWRRNR